MWKNTRRGNLCMCWSSAVRPISASLFGERKPRERKPRPVVPLLMRGCYVVFGGTALYSCVRFLVSAEHARSEKTPHAATPPGPSPRLSARILEPAGVHEALSAGRPPHHGRGKRFIYGLVDFCCRVLPCRIQRPHRGRGKRVICSSLYYCVVFSSHKAYTSCT